MLERVKADSVSSDVRFVSEEAEDFDLSEWMDPLDTVELERELRRGVERGVLARGELSRLLEDGR